MIDNKPPETYMHLHLNLKKMQMEEERLATVQRDNRILLEKMSHIMTTKARTDNVNGYHHRRYIIIMLYRCYQTEAESNLMLYTLRSLLFAGTNFSRFHDSLI